MRRLPGQITEMLRPRNFRFSETSRDSSVVAAKGDRWGRRAQWEFFVDVGWLSCAVGSPSSQESHVADDG